jgi:1-acyl-sn-glycerol-3-phosphate acyltransferase
VRKYLSFAILLAIKGVSRLLYSFESRWIGPWPEDAWRSIRLLCFLNHTSLFEPLFAGLAPVPFLWQLASRAVAPVADKTMRRPLVGPFIRLLVRHPVSITREPDHTWQAVLARIEPDSLVAILPEGRMRRSTGLDRDGQPMTVRGGIADILHERKEGRMLIAYSGGLHHVQIPGQRLPRLFQTLRMSLELVDIATYRGDLLERFGEDGFKRAVKADLDRRRDLHAPVTPESCRQPAS